MKTLTTRERITRMYEHREADRIPVMDHPWSSTIERWQAEGMPADVHFADYFDMDRIESIHPDNSPCLLCRVVEETEEYKIFTSAWGVTMKQWKHANSTPEFLDFTIVDRDSWEKAKARMTMDSSRIPWNRLEREYPTWREKGYWITGILWFGFDVTHSWMVGTERLLVALAEDREWCMDLFDHHLDLSLKLLDKVWDAGYTFDEVFWPDDMGYKHSQFFSVSTYRELLKPFHRRAVDWAHAKGIKARLHSCGDVNPFVPELIDIGVDALNPLEVKAGMDPVTLKRQYGSKLLFHGGLDALLWTKPDAFRAAMESVVPVMKQSGGYIFSTDHSVPSDVSLEAFRGIVEYAKVLGRY
jgi:uroporphyrinogen decarboxylase